MDESSKELEKIRKLLILMLTIQGVSPKVIGSAIGVTQAEKLRKLVPYKIPKKLKSN